jgi:hypothetical protein
MPARISKSHKNLRRSSRLDRQVELAMHVRLRKAPSPPVALATQPGRMEAAALA